MLFYGESFNKVFLKPGTLIVSLTSYDESLPRLEYLIPPRELGKYVDKDFDIAYANYILNNNDVFYQFFTIIYDLYVGEDVYIAASSYEWSDNLIQSLCKLIQARYGYNAVNIQSYEDYIHAKSTFNPDFDIYKLETLDMDRARYTYLMEEYRLRSGAKVVVYSDGQREYLD